MTSSRTVPVTASSVASGAGAVVARSIPSGTVCATARELNETAAKKPHAAARRTLRNDIIPLQRIDLGGHDNVIIDALCQSRIAGEMHHCCRATTRGAAMVYSSSRCLQQLPK